jgi:hypothetical protein
MLGHVLLYARLVPPGPGNRSSRRLPNVVVGHRRCSLSPGPQGLAIAAQGCCSMLSSAIAAAAQTQATRGLALHLRRCSCKLLPATAAAAQSQAARGLALKMAAPMLFMQAADGHRRCSSTSCCWPPPLQPKPRPPGSGNRSSRRLPNVVIGHCRCSQSPGLQGLAIAAQGCCSMLSSAIAAAAQTQATRGLALHLRRCSCKLYRLRAPMLN